MARNKKAGKDLTFEVLRAALHEECRKLGALAIEARYSGGGDDGQIDVVCLDTGDGLEKSGVCVTWFVDAGQAWDQAMGRFIPVKAGTQVMPLKDAVLAYCYTLIDKHHPGDWVNNEGGGGTLTIELTIPPKITLDCYDNVTSRQSWLVDCETGDIEDKGIST